VGQSEFQQSFRTLAQRRGSRLVLALDVEDYGRARGLAEACGGELAALKVHPEHALLWGVSHAELVKTLSGLAGGAPVILDAKLADIGESNAFKARYYFAQGYGAIICHGFPGEKAVKAVVGEADARGRGVLLLAAMTSEGHLFNESNADALVAIARQAGAAGVIAPGNQYELLARIRSRLGSDALVLSPGIGAQGGEAAQAFRAGADLAIVGRAIVNAADPKAAARELKEALNQAAGGR
jgi:orotidine-5'-phosphate decarboxylase